MTQTAEDWIKHLVDSVYANPNVGSCWVLRRDNSSYNVVSVDGVFVTLRRGDGVQTTVTHRELKRDWRPT